MKLQQLLVPLLLLISVASGLPQGVMPPQINVTGSAEVKVAPDEIHLSVGVETRHEALEDAKRLNDERIAQVIKFIKKSGVADKDVQTDFLQVEPNYENSVSRTKPTIYVMQKSIEIRFTKITAFEEFVTGLLANGVTTIHGIDFRTTQLRKHRDTARAMAVRAAKEKADALASELSVKRGRVYNINATDASSWSGGSYWGRRGAMMTQNSTQDMGGGNEAADSTLSVGQISVTASVNVTFLIE